MGGQFEYNEHFNCARSDHFADYQSIGGLIVLFVDETESKVLSVSLDFRPQVMVYISFVEMLSESNRLLVAD